MCDEFNSLDRFVKKPPSQIRTIKRELCEAPRLEQFETSKRIPVLRIIFVRFRLPTLNGKTSRPSVRSFHYSHQRRHDRCRCFASSVHDRATSAMIEERRRARLHHELPIWNLLKLWAKALRRRRLSLPAFYFLSGATRRGPFFNPAKQGHFT